MIGDPGGGEAAVVLPFGEFVVVIASDGVVAVVAGAGRDDVYAAGLLGVGGGERCGATVEKFVATEWPRIDTD